MLLFDSMHLQDLSSFLNDVNLCVCHLKGLTGRPGDAGSQGKVGPTVSTIVTQCFLSC